METADATARMVLEEMQLMEARLTEKIAGRCEGMQQRVEQRCDELHQHFTHRCDTIHQQVDVAALRGEERLMSLELLKTEVDVWKPEITKKVEDLSLEMARVGKFLEREFRPHVVDQPGIFGPYQSASARPPGGIHHADGPFGRRPDLHYRDRESGPQGVPTHIPVKGTFSAHPSRLSGFMAEQYYPHESPREYMRPSLGRLPKLNFPQFDGSQPRLWKSKCEKYFEMYETEYFMWVKVATMHFEGRAARWLQAVEHTLGIISWEEFCNLVHERFGREQHESLIRQLFHIRQSGAVSEYVEQFASLVDELAAYESRTDPIYYTMRFVEGLKHEIKSVVMVQRPTNLDAACALALVQEEALDSMRGRRRAEPISNRMAWPHAAPATEGNRVDKGDIPPDSFHTETRRAGSSTDRVASLKSYRRARGLCDRCAEKWFPGHKCPSAVQLHAIEEVWDMLEEEKGVEPAVEEPQPTLMALSGAAWTGSDVATAFRVSGTIQNHQMVFLIDSGSSHTFISEKWRSSMLDVQPLSRKITVKVANGQVLNCEHHLSKDEWYISNYKFRSDLIFVQLPSVDLVVGMDWLQAYSPMEVDWYNKWMAIPYHGHTICIQGVQSSFPTGAMIELRLSMGDMKTDQIQSTTEKTIDPRIQVVLPKFADLFSEPVGLHPSRHCDHSIPLVPGANPFTVRPYRYPPALKDEIEKQVQEMLAHGVIQKSRSPFASPVLLVKKKDRSWRFCVDYRYLNAMTAKSKYPVPIFDQLMDELVTTKWFSKLDLRTGYHQIRLLPGEEPKTTFQTHMGHFEFRVMAFGLTGAPNTFLDAMNTTLAPVLRKCALVSFDDILIYSHFLALSHPFSAAEVAKLFLDNISKLHGMPDSIVSDRDRVFTSNFWQQLFTLTGTQLCMSSAYHPQSDGQTERVNQCIETDLRCFVHACPNKWSLWLSVTEFWYNTNFHSAVGRSPFEVLYGHSLRHFGLHTTEAVPVAELTAWLQDREVISKLVRQHLLRAQARMKQQADKQRSEREFSMGDQVYLKLQPYVQSSVTARSNQKLSFRFFGPYVILERIGQVAYKLKLPESALIHPVFHVSQVKSALGRLQVVVPHLPFTNDPLQVHVQVVDRRMIQRNRTMIAQVEVVWSGMDAELATWEDVEALYNRFPRAPAWGQAVIEERGNVSTKGEQALSEEEPSGEGRQREEESKRARIRRRNVLYCGCSKEWDIA
jgi:hypothetical protein